GQPYRCFDLSDDEGSWQSELSGLVGLEQEIQAMASNIDCFSDDSSSASTASSDDGLEDGDNDDHNTDFVDDGGGDDGDDDDGVDGADAWTRARERQQQQR
ncbi:unnamed protein product, partial [Laminaria digitata]